MATTSTSTPTSTTTPIPKATDPAGAIATSSTSPTVAGIAGAGNGGLAGRTIVLDPGHNGRNGQHIAEINRPVDVANGTKACNTTGTASGDGYAESAFNLDVALRTRSLVEADGATVVLSRADNDGWGPCIDRRAAIANDARADASVSIHADGAASSGHGFHVIVPRPIAGLNSDIAPASVRLGVALRDALLGDLGSRPAITPSTYVGKDGLIARDDLGGLNLARVPAAFVECGNMRNASDLAVLRSADGRQRIARAIVDGLRRFLTPG